MSRKPNIPFGDKRRSELNKANANIRRKQKSLSKRFDGLQADFEVKSAADFSSIKEFNAYIEQAKQFTKRTANKFDLVNPDNGSKVSYNTLRKIEAVARRANRIKDQEFSKLKDLPHREQGRLTGLTIGENMDKRIGFTDPKFEHFKHVKPDYKNLAGERDAKLQLSKLNDRYEGDFISRSHQQYFQNYIQSLHTRFNQSTTPFGLKLPQEIWSVIDKLIEMGIDGFMNLYYQGKIPNIPFIYGKDRQEIVLQELMNAFFPEE
jgi:hypothetical protein